ncbi:MAG: cupin domain-containing protein [Dehalococcoidia bacterium]|nr:cupin domain-containing protein [Dehalococcoidia bacterium]
MADRLEELFQRRDRERSQKANSIAVVKGKQLPWEVNRQGKMRWYLHPNIDTTAIRSLLVFIQEIPPGSRSGKEKHQGGRVHYILEGKGYTIIDGTKHEWEAGDAMVLPVKPDGVTFQHFNADSEKTVRFIAAEPNLFDALGVDMGSGFEQLENAPEFKA